MDRRISNEQVWKATTDYISSPMEAERLGYDSFWTTEHHFQHEGYEVIPNGIHHRHLDRARNVLLGTMFNVVPQWNPLRLAGLRCTTSPAAAASSASVMAPCRGVLPQRQGRVDRSYDNPDQAADDDRNRRVFEESMDIVRAALTGETFAYEGEFFHIPVPGIPDRGSTVQSLTPVPPPLYPFEIWQAVTSPPTLEYVPVVGHGAVFWNQHHAFIKRFWDTYGERYAAAHDGHVLAPHERRMLVVSVRIEDTHEKALETATPGHDEFWKFLGPYGWSRGYMGPDGKPAQPASSPPWPSPSRTRRSSSARR